IDVMTHGEFDDYWKTQGCSPDNYYDDHADVPIYYLGGWYDMYAGATSRNYTELSRRHTSETRLIFGPWLHGQPMLSKSYSGDADFGPDAIIDYDQLRLSWFREVF